MDNGWGLSTGSPFKTIQYAIDMREPCQTIFVMNGTYRNHDFGRSLDNRNNIVNLNGVSDMKLLAYPNAGPILKFDGSGGIMGGSPSNPISNIEISGFEIEGPNEKITYEDATKNRIIKSARYTGRGVAIWAGNHIYIHDMEIHHCPGSGIRVNKGDYVTIADNKVYSNTWWSSSAESGVVIAESKHIDEYEGIKIRLSNNIAYDNVNKIPFYDSKMSWDYSPIGNYDCGTFSACEEGLVDGCPWQCRYGKKSQDYIIDGVGVYVTRNKDTYLYGQMELSYNTCYKNGINGLSYHRTDRGVIKMNSVYGNGVVPRLDKQEPVLKDWHRGCSGKSRQPWSGIAINNAIGVKLWSNVVAARYDDDFAFKQIVDGSSPSPSLIKGGNNKVCQGLVDKTLKSVVHKTTNLTVCGMSSMLQSSSRDTSTPSFQILTSNISPSTYCIDDMNSIFNFTNVSGQTWEFTCKRLSNVKQNPNLTAWFNNICKSNGNELCPLTCDNCNQARTAIPSTHIAGQSSSIPTALQSIHPSSQPSSVPTAFPSAPPNVFPIVTPSSLPSSFPITITRLSNYFPSSLPLFNEDTLSTTDTPFSSRTRRKSSKGKKLKIVKTKTSKITKL